ncbi:MAG: acyltransferase [Sphingobacteriales bacterium]|nr:MAG: acyltransferase [Sphingobacteriales bacterium]
MKLKSSSNNLFRKTPAMVIMEFRKDINGLRAIAVLAVVLFHFGVPGLSGGFAGVDVFFVISGFLMTGIITSKLENKKFSISSFYLDRCRRIIPALAAVSGMMLVVGYFVLIPEELNTLGKHVGSSLTFVSNIVYWTENGYFDLASHDKWMLHTWSLSVEWQFYIIYPLLIIFLQKTIGLNSFRFVIAACAALSFMLSLYASTRWPGAAFYLLPTRAWEMLVGGLIYLFPLNRGRLTSLALEYIGLLLIAVSFFIFDSESIWPGWRALVPVLGASLVIYSARTDSVLICNRLSQIIGKSSYSIYLWHWPMAVFIGYWGLKGQLAWIITGVIGSIVIGYFSYRYVENIAGKNKEGFIDKVGVTKAMFLFFGASCLALIALICDGLPARMGPNFAEQTKNLVMPLPDNGWCFYGVDSSKDLTVGDKGLKCILGKKGASQKGILFGDSYAGHNAPFWDVVGKDLSIEINSVSTNWCFPSFQKDFTGPTSSRAYQQCLINRSYLLENLEQYEVVIFAGSWGSVYEQEKMRGLLEAIALTASRSKFVIVMAAPTAFDVNVKYRYERSLLWGNKFDISNLSKDRDTLVRSANEKLREASEQYDNVIYLSRNSLFNVNGKPSDVTEENIPYSLDGGHISVYGSLMSASAFKNSSSFDNLKHVLSINQK